MPATPTTPPTTSDYLSLSGQDESDVDNEQGLITSEAPVPLNQYLAGMGVDEDEVKQRSDDDSAISHPLTPGEMMEAD